MRQRRLLLCLMLLVLAATGGCNEDGVNQMKQIASDFTGDPPPEPGDVEEPKPAPAPPLLVAPSRVDLVPKIEEAAKRAVEIKNFIDVSCEGENRYQKWRLYRYHSLPSRTYVRKTDQGLVDCAMLEFNVTGEVSPFLRTEAEARRTPVNSKQSLQLNYLVEFEFDSGEWLLKSARWARAQTTSSRKDVEQGSFHLAFLEWLFYDQVPQAVPLLDESPDAA